MPRTRTSEGWLDLAVVLDLFSRMVVGWAMAEHMRGELTLAALNMAIARQRTSRGLTHHSDRGSQYAATAYRAALASIGAHCSMSRRGDPFDNAPMESFFKTLRAELADDANYATHAEARRDVFAFLEAWYNRQRLHSAIGYITRIPPVTAAYPCCGEPALVPTGVLWSAVKDGGGWRDGDHHRG